MSQEIVTSECSSISSVHSKDDDFEKVCDSIRNNMADEVVIQLNFIKTEVNDDGRHQSNSENSDGNFKNDSYLHIKKDGW